MASPASAYFLTFQSRKEARVEEERLAVDGYNTCLKPWRGMWRLDATPPLDAQPYDWSK